MNYLQKLIYFSFLLFAGLLLSGCTDDFFNNDEAVGEGQREINISLQFNPMHDVEITTRSTPGNAIEDINSLTIVAYDNEDNFIRVYNPGDEDITVSKQYSKQVSMLDANGNEMLKQVATVDVSIRNVPFGRYKFYAVANVGSLSDSQVDTPEKLKNIQYSWNSNVKANNQLFGYFSMESQGQDINRPFNFEADAVIVNKNHNQYNAWLRRLVSKVTVGYDGSGLKPDVLIYIKSVQIKDIPKSCLLGENNTPSSASELTNGEKICYNSNNEIVETEVPDYQHGMLITRGTPLLAWHGDSDPSMFFFENMQGNYEGQKKYDKRQDKTQVGTNITSPGQTDFKDEVPYGTYIEVDAFYVSINPENPTSGKITYRFMLGQNDTFDYNAQRNHHYRVTLGFKGWANQPDWHINYEEEDPGIEAPDEFDVSYSYNQKATLPIKINGNCVSFEARIVRNDWQPCDPSQPDSLAKASYGGNWAWYKQVGEEFTGTKYPYLGFLALQADVQASDGEIPTNILMNRTFSDGQSALDDLKAYYEGHGQNHRVYNVTPNSYVGSGFVNKAGRVDWNGYEVKNANDTKDPAKHTPCEASASACRLVYIPLITRNKTMIDGAGWTGNNIYESFTRKAVVRLTAGFKLPGGSIVYREKFVTIYQVPRLVNPKAVWHSAKNTDPFNVTLCYEEGPDDDRFTIGKSRGEWKAYVYSQNVTEKFLSLSGGNESANDTIYGYTNTPVNFDINFNSEAGTNESRCAIVRVQYHGYQCSHYILVRQGYEDPIDVADDGNYWSSFSIYSMDEVVTYNSGGGTPVKAVLCKNPLFMGTLFKFKNYNRGIRLVNNETYGPLDPIVGPDGEVGLFQTTNTSGAVNISWKNISPGNAYSSGWHTFTQVRNGKTHTYRIPTAEDFKGLNMCEFAVGVIYGDGAGRTQMTRTKAFNFKDPGNLGVTSENGIRGFVLYDRKTAKNIILPIGPWGMSRRTEFNLQRSGDQWKGMLRYADVTDRLTIAKNPNNKYRAPVYNLPYSPGGIYWIDKLAYCHGSNNGACLGWDLNYSWLEFSPYTNNNKNDACAIRLIEVK